MIPKTLVIGSQTYRVVQVNKKELGDSLGDVDITHNLIRLYRHLPPSRKAEVALHEALHAMLFVQAFRDEEKIVSVLGKVLLQFIRDNPEFITHLQQTC